jgi:hypothetical protein
VIIGDVGGADSDRSEIREEGESDRSVGVGGTPGRVNAGVLDPVWADSSSRPSETGSSVFCIEY